MTTQKLTGKLARWSLLLQEYDFTVEHRAGVENTNADCLSRYPLPSNAATPVLDWTKGEVMVGNALPTHAGEEEKDIWSDVEVLRFLQTYKYGDGLSAKERDRIYRRAKGYRWMGDSVFKRLSSNVMVVVPSVAKRENIALETHRGMGHFSVQHVLDRLQKNYWWRGMGDTVVRIIKSCLSCARVKVGFRESGKELHPLIIRGLGYRWGVDFVGPLALTKAGNKWVLVCIEHFTK